MGDDGDWYRQLASATPAAAQHSTLAAYCSNPNINTCCPPPPRPAHPPTHNNTLMCPPLPRTHQHRWQLRWRRRWQRALLRRRSSRRQRPA
jgi:hypothetical protein